MQEEKEVEPVSIPPAGNEGEEIIVAEPQSTLYVANLDWSIKKPTLRRALHSLFGRHGKVSTSTAPLQILIPPRRRSWKWSRYVAKDCEAKLG